MRINYFIKIFPFEALVWLLGITYLIFFVHADSHFTICPFNNLGISFCPGCGLGRSITLLFQLRFWDSFNTHPLGLMALIILLYRSITLLVIYRKKFL
jgi:hypothetical protein